MVRGTAAVGCAVLATTIKSAHLGDEGTLGVGPSQRGGPDQLGDV